MKTLSQFTLLAVFGLLFSACAKDENNIQLDAGAINVTNAVIGGTTLTLITSPSIVSNSNTVSLNNFAFMPVVSGQTKVTLGIPAVAATEISPAIPEIDYFSQVIPIDNTSNYSLFLTGTSSAAVDDVLIKENFTRTYADSVCGVRFINLAPGSNPISVNIKDGANGSEVSSLAYKSYSDFKLYPAKAANKILLFEIRDAETGALLLPETPNGNVYTLTIPYFHNVTLCYRGTGTAVGIIQTNNY